MAGTRRGSGEQAVNLVLDRRYFVLSEEAFEEVNAMLDAPPKDYSMLRRLLETKAPWER